MSEQNPEREDSEAGSYVDLQGEVDKVFDGSWEAFLKAVRNPAEILYFVLWRQCDGKAHKMEAWAKDKGLPPDWIPRFFGMLTHEGQFRPDVETRAPAPTDPQMQPPPEAKANVELIGQVAQTGQAEQATQQSGGDGDGN